MVHPGRGIFGSDFGTTSFIIAKRHITRYIGNYRRLFDKQGEVETIEVRNQAFLSGKGSYTAKQESFSKIPGSPVAYWVGKNLLSILSTRDTIGKHYDVGSGLSTADNERFLRFHWEVSSLKIAERKDSLGKKWFHFQKGGEFRRWYGNLEYIVNWENDGDEIKYWVTHNPKDPNTTSWSRRIFNVPLYFQHGITWAVIGIGKISFRETNTNAMISNAAGGIFSFETEDDFYNLLGGLNTKIWGEIFQIISPTVNYSAGIIQKAPLPHAQCSRIVRDCIQKSKSDWDSFETSWDFKSHPLVSLRMSGAFAWGDDLPTLRLSSAYKSWQLLCEERFNQLKANEEELNRIFIDIYGLQDELTPEIEDKDVTVRKADLGRDIRSLISYAVGCMFGRYSLDVEGLILAGQDYESRFVTDPHGYSDGIPAILAGDFIRVSDNSENIKVCTYLPDKDNIIPICDDEYFDDDITGRFVAWVETVYGKDTLEENLKFIADALEGKGTPREVIRNYFINDFYADHLKIYQKRPIYWLFDSGKKNGFKALIYMHRYQPDTIARIRTDYVHEQQSRYRTAIADLEQRINGASTSERVKLSKQLAKLQAQAEEIRIYEEKIHHLADQMIKIDLDDGVKHNYAIFGDVLAKIK